MPMGKFLLLSKSLVFFMPNVSDNDRELIEQNGGMLSHIVECFTYQVARKPIKDQMFSAGIVYDIRWIYESLQADKMLDPKPFIIK